ncbi:hypothetical protein CGX12_03520 [Zobellella denitrificans]|uniref:Uncharacterized protein n=1 Tax=Zobellella denitrificans TaxID=347534 RepID=A0A231N1T8_9GAMM|nr:protein YgfX [Zobellella denitrificans]ATG72844.1 hypothetical protein AN401_02390 [Zobellella denitrificans]OXS16463.1 hypothetical protein CGX12_03520 [Zobellella denitrificans]
MNATRFAISAEPSLLHRCYLMAAASTLWLPASLWLAADRLPWFLPGWLLALWWLGRRGGAYRLEGEFNQGVLRLNGRSGVLSRHSRAGPGFLLLVLEGDPWPPFWLFQDAVPDEVFRRLSRLVLSGG